MKKGRKVTITVFPKENKTVVSGTGDAWADMAYILEGLGVICEACINEGRTSEEVYREVQRYFNKVGVAGYKVTKLQERR